MMNPQIIQYITYGWIALAILIYIVLHFVKAPFGRHTSESWGPSVNNKWGWFIMELPSFLLMLFFLIAGTHSRQGYTWILFLLWLIHYFNRTFVYPIRIRPTPKRMPWMIVLNAIFFNLMNAGLNGYYLAECTTSDSYDMR